jgi:hypothetical protein
VRNLISAVVVSLAVCGTLVAGQEAGQKSTSKITVKDGKDVTLTGCVERSREGGFVLTNAAGKQGVSSSYVLVGEEADDLEEHVNHRVEIKGKAADKGDGRVRIETKSEVENGSGDKRKRESKTEVEGDLDGLPFLGVKSVRMLATVCP